MKSVYLLSLALLSLVATTVRGAEALAAQAKIDAYVTLIRTWASDPIVIDAVRAQNVSLAPERDALNQERWHNLPSLDPIVRGLSKGVVGAFLSSKRSAVIGEAFVSDATGRKVGFITKTTRWNHTGLPKHEVPMSGKTWQGRVELDESTGLRLIQIAVPVLDAGKPIGSLVVGLSTAFLSE